MRKIKHIILSILFLVILKKFSLAQIPTTSIIENRLKTLGVILPESTPSSGNVIGAVTVGNLVFLSGHGPDKPEGGQVIGKVGDNLTIEEGREAARLAGIALLKTLKSEIGNLDRVKRIVKVLGMVNATPDLTEQPKVINGFSEFIVEVFGKEKGPHARSAVGLNSLPSGIAVEIEMIVEIE
ncbi:RidA family protein [Olivibacter sitiensis]|uniref:RidA family protein n=1 Tax=Olivibacter sitiensis TaxID=376470 RepID=UPI0005614206|nr:RidA family protein [Olivibacter sitiensis]